MDSTEAQGDNPIHSNYLLNYPTIGGNHVMPGSASNALGTHSQQMQPMSVGSHYGNGNHPSIIGQDPFWTPQLQQLSSQQSMTNTDNMNNSFGYSNANAFTGGPSQKDRRGSFARTSNFYLGTKNQDLSNSLSPNYEAQPEVEPQLFQASPQDTTKKSRRRRGFAETMTESDKAKEIRNQKEKNCAAASRCREKKRLRLLELEDKVAICDSHHSSWAHCSGLRKQNHLLTGLNQSLTTESQFLKAEVDRLRAKVAILERHQSDSQMIGISANGYNKNPVASMNSSTQKKSTQMSDRLQYHGGMDTIFSLTPPESDWDGSNGFGDMRSTASAFNSGIHTSTADSGQMNVGHGFTPETGAGRIVNDQLLGEEASILPSNGQLLLQGATNSNGNESSSFELEPGLDANTDGVFFLEDLDVQGDYPMDWVL